MATKVNISLKPENAIKGISVGFPYIVDEKKSSKRREFVVVNFDGTGLAKEFVIPLKVTLSRHYGSFSDSIYVNASKFTREFITDTDPAFEFVTSVISSKYIEECNKNNHMSPSYFYDENFDVNMRIDLFRIFTNTFYDFIDIMEDILYDYKGYINSIDYKDCPF